MDNFVYNAPCFFDFSMGLAREDSKNAEAFFEIEHVRHNGPVAGTSSTMEENEKESEQEFYTPLKVTPNQKHEKDLRRSISLTDLSANVRTDDDIETISTALATLHVDSTKKQRTVRSSVYSARTTKTHPMDTRADVPKLYLRSRSVCRANSRSNSRDRTRKLTQSRSTTVSQENVTLKKFVSMAEAINQFHQKTPARFHSKSKTECLFVAGKRNGPIPTTIPQSPSLTTKQRTQRIRPVHVLSREDQEMKEYEDAQKFKIKAHPVNAKILQGPVLLKDPSCPKKSPTKPEPFKLTQIPVRKPPSSPQLVPFHAKPVPKCVLEAPKPILKSNLCTVAHTPKLMKRYAHDKTKNETMTEEPKKDRNQPLKPTAPAPFSFMKRDEDIIKRREKLLLEIMEEEKKAREFHARPIPKSVFRSPQHLKNVSIYAKRQRSDGSIYKSVENLSDPVIFKARPAKVLQMKPFEPKKEERPLTEISPFNLNTERRATERDDFERQRKEKEERVAQLIKQRQEEILRQEEEEVARLRKAAEHKAQPIRRYKDVEAPVALKQLTNPMSPRFSYRKKHSDKENSCDNSEKQ